MQNIFISGASSGMGAALALRYAAAGRTLALVARNPERLADVAHKAREAGARCRQGLVDVTDAAAVRAFIDECDRESPIDLAIINAGVFDGRRTDQTLEDLETSARVIDINLIGALNTLHAILPGMRKRGRGHIVLMSSLAGMCPIGGGLGYSASKAAILSYGLGLKQVLHAEGIMVSVVCPGFVETPITKRHLGWQPFKITADQAALKIMRGVARKNAVIAFPLVLHIMTRSAILMPDFVRRIVGRVFACHAGAPDAAGSGGAPVAVDSGRIALARKADF